MPLVAIFSDVHGNVRDLERALSYFQSRDIQAFMQLGDLGVEPLSLLVGLNVQHVFGNWEIRGLHRFPLERQLEIARWPARLVGSTWIASHATPDMPATCTDLATTRHYLVDQRPRRMQLFPSLLHDENAIWLAIAHLEEQKKLVAFHGHTHVQAVQSFGKDNKLTRVSGRIIGLPEGTCTLVGVGSVGAPRDGSQPRCVLFDSEANQVELVAVP